MCVEFRRKELNNSGRLPVLTAKGKGAFRRFKDTLYRVDEQWLQAWYQWRDKQLKAAVNE